MVVHFVGNARGEGGSVVGSVEVVGAVVEFGSDAVQVGDEETGVDLLELADRTVKHGHRAVLVASQGREHRDGRRIGLFAALAKLGGEWRELIGQGTGGGDVVGFEFQQCEAGSAFEGRPVVTACPGELDGLAERGAGGGDVASPRLHEPEAPVVLDRLSGEGVERAEFVE
jgi:hypothetical protein